MRNQTAPGEATSEGGGDEDFWIGIQQAFDIDRSWINLNNGGVSPAPRIVLDALRRHVEHTNQLPAKYLFESYLPQVESVRGGLARMFGCDPEEIAITRNASESMEICLLGIELKRGDEVLCSSHDYPRMLTTLRQREKREAVVLKTFPLPAPAESHSQLLERYERNITPRTRMILIPHIIHHTGQIMPVREVIKFARSRGIEVVVDGGHSFAHLPFQHSDIDCDYYGTSLHKWLLAPVGTGMLFVQKNKIAGLWPLMPAEKPKSDDIRKFEEIGAHPVAPYLAIAEAIAFTEAIGTERKAARLRYLRDRWAGPLRSRDRVRFYTNLEPSHSCGIATFGIDGISGKDLADHLVEKHCILVSPIQHETIDGIRVSPNVYTSVQELEVFVEVIETILTRGLK